MDRLATELIAFWATDKDGNPIDWRKNVAEAGYSYEQIIAELKEIDMNEELTLADWQEVETILKGEN